MTELHVVYRSTGPGNGTRRPLWFDKALCLASLLRAAERCLSLGSLVFVNDGELPTGRLSAMAEHGRVVHLPGVGNSGSYRHAFDLATTLSPASTVLLAEDDYLWRPEALTALTAAFAEQPDFDYLTPYDHPDHAADVAVARWRPVPSTCMTYAARTDALRCDRWLHRLATVPNTPRDHRLWLATQRIGGFRLLPGRGRRLGSPASSLATHAHEGLVAAGIDWDAVAEETRAWAGDASLPCREDPASVG